MSHATIASPGAVGQAVLPRHRLTGNESAVKRVAEQIFKQNLRLGKTYTLAILLAPCEMLPILDTTSYYNFLSGTMITLFVVTLAIIFVYEYEVLRRPKTQS
jgi:hypothetical protein